MKQNNGKDKVESQRIPMIFKERMGKLMIGGYPWLAKFILPRQNLGSKGMLKP